MSDRIAGDEVLIEPEPAVLGPLRRYRMKLRMGRVRRARPVVELPIVREASE